MRKAITLLLVVFFALSAVPAQDRTANFDGKKMLERVKRLSSDDFEGRGPGTQGGKLAAQFIADELKAGGVKPADNGSYFQNVKLVGVKADPNTALQVISQQGTAALKFGDDYVATTGAQAANVDVDAELVFAGYGIEAPLYNWNDYSGDPADYRGKVLMIMVNDPPATAAEPNLFGGKALTYYGRWTYKYEEAARRGAAGVILIHTDESAGYGWNVVRTSNGSWRYEIARSPNDASPFLKVKGWATNDAAARILRNGNLDLDKLRENARQRGFKPVQTGLRVKINLASQLQTLDSPNVVGQLQGAEPKLKDEYVVYTAHWDHLGIGEPDARGDRIYNGAYDNASGVAALLGIADVVAKLPKDQRPKRSMLFVFPTAEEQGLLGAEYYSRHPLIPLSKTAANINIDGVNFFGKTSDFSALGAERSTIAEAVDAAARERNLTVRGDIRPDQGFFFRSDHFPFAKVGVPSVSLRHGETFVPALRGPAAEFFHEYEAKYYHQASDEFKEWWNAAAMVQEAELALAIGMKLANAAKMPRFESNDEFADADRKRMRQ
jgi:Zn-dependent M28 family amino/carboxypeptidase